MKIVEVIPVLCRGPFAESPGWISARGQLFNALTAIDWPRGSGSFSIYPESGKRRGMGNGVDEIKIGFVKEMVCNGWLPEEKLERKKALCPGPLDLKFPGVDGHVFVEWETGNISSSHRAMNKMALGMLSGEIRGGVLVVPSCKLARYLTDRIGNPGELRPYIDLWSTLPIDNGILEIVVLEHDFESFDVPRLPKRTDGRAIA